MSSLLFKLIIDGTNAGAIKALAGVSAEAQKTGAGLSRLDLAAGGLRSTRATLNDISGQLRGLQGLFGQVLGFAGISLGFSALVQLSDEYKSMTGRLRLATQYTGDFAEAQTLLQQSARDTRSDLAATVDLYVKMAPSLQAIGYNTDKIAGVITTINQAIGISGASTQAAAAALMQLGQGFGSGILRGEELNSVLEQTPALAQAIADGLGVPIGELRRMGEEGKLTAEVVAGALEKVEPQLRANFEKMPKTVGQAMTALRNEVLRFVGVVDDASGGSSVLANVINEIALSFKEAGPVVTALAEGVKILINGFDGAYRAIKIVLIGLAGYTAAAQAALSGNFSGARQIWQDLGRDIEAVLQKPLLTEPMLVKSATDTAKKRALLEEQLKVQVEKLEKAKAYIAGQSSDSIVAKDKEIIDKRIADQQRLVDAVRAAWQESLAEADKAMAAADQRRQKAQDYRQRGQDAAFNAGLKGMTPEQQAVAQAQRLQELAQQGNYESARARVAALDGDAKLFEATAVAAEKKLLAALELAERVGDTTAAEDIANELAKLQEAGAGMEEKKAAAAQAQAQAQAATLNQLQVQLEAMQKTAREIEVQADVTKAEGAIKGLKNQLDALQNKTVTVTVNTVNTGGTPVPTPTADDAPARAYGGPLPGWAPHDRADNMLYRGTPGEWVIQRPAVRYWGSDFIAAINAMRLPNFAFGGQLGGSIASRLRVPSVSPAAAGTGSGAPAILDLGALGRIRMRTAADTVDDVEAVIKRAALRYGRH